MTPRPGCLCQTRGLNCRQGRDCPALQPVEMDCRTPPSFDELPELRTSREARAFWRVYAIGVVVAVAGALAFLYDHGML